MEAIHVITPKRDKDDSWLWAWANDGKFTVKVLSSLIYDAASEHCDIETIWLKLVPKKVNFLL